MVLKRVLEVHLSDAGREALDSARHEQPILDALSADELTTLRALPVRCIEAIEAHSGLAAP